MIRSSYLQLRQHVLAQCLTQVPLNSHFRSLCSKISQFDISVKHVYCDHNFQMESSKFRNTLYPDSSDAILKQLKSCKSVQEVLDIFHSNQKNFTSQHLCQTILILRDIQKVFNKYYLNDIMMTSAHRYDTEIDESNHAVFHTFQVEMCKNEIFISLLSKISEQCSLFNVDEAVCTMLYLRYLGLGIKHDTIQRLISHSEEMFKISTDTPISYQTLSRYFSVFKYEVSLYTVMQLSKQLPLVISQLDNCTDIYSLGQTSVCLENIEGLVNSDLRSLFRTKLEEILNKLTIKSVEDTRSLMKILNFLNSSFWYEENGPLMQKILLQLADFIHLLDIKEIIYLQRVFSRQLEPYLFLDHLQKQVQFIVSRCEDLRGEPSLGTLVCMAPVATYKQKKYLEKTLLKKLQEPGNVLNTMPTLATISDLTRFLQSDNYQIHSLLWNRVLVLLQDEPNIAFLIFFTNRYIKRYLHKKNFRNLNFEHFATQSLLKEIEFASPNSLSEYGSAILKFCPKFVRSKIPDVLYTKLVNNVPQMNLVNCFLLMDALSSTVTLHAPQSKTISPDFSVQFTQLENRLESRLNQILDDSEYVSILDCFEIFLKRKCKHWQHIYEKLYTKIRADRVTSKLIYAACRHIVFSEKYGVTDSLLDKCVSYCEVNQDVIIGFVVSYVLYASYLCAYPLHITHPAFLEIASSVLLRDKDSLTALLMIRASLSLAYFNALPRPLASHIFSLDFLEYLEEEMCENSSQSLTLRIRNDLMELNRAVCLDFAHYDIPWFHQKFAHQAALAESCKPLERIDKFRSDVYSVLVRYVGDQARVLADFVSPYGQKIDFLLYLDKQGNPITIRDPRSKSQIQTRLAILLEQKSGQGQSDLRRRHLELQGYSVLNLYKKQWNALFMGEPRAKQVFLDQVLRQYRPMIASSEHL